MKLPRRTFMSLTAAALGAAALPRVARAQTYPSRPITLVVLFPPGGPPTRSRGSLADRMRARSASRCDRERVRRGGTMECSRVARGNRRRLHAEHRALGLARGQRRSLFAALRPARRSRAGGADLRGAATSRRGEVGPGQQRARAIAWLKANPGKAMVGTTGVGGASHLAAVLFAEHHRHQTSRSCPIAARRRACRTCSPARSIWRSIRPPSALPQVQGGNLQAYAVTAKDAARRRAGNSDRRRSRTSRASTCRSGTALWASKGTPKDVIGQAQRRDDRRARRRDGAPSGWPNSGRSAHARAANA